LAATTRTLPDEVKTLFRERIEALPGGLPLSRDAFLRALEKAWRGCGLDARTVVSRFLWLVDPQRPGTEGVRVFEHFPSFTQEQLAHAIVDPRDTVIEIIAAKSGIERATLLEIREAIVSRGNPGEYGQIADLAEERILQEMKWWLTDLRFPEYYLRNTPPALMARQIMLNRSYELAGFESDAYTRMKVSSTSPDGTSMHWVHKDRSIEVEEEIEKEYYAGASLFNIAAYTPYQNLLLYVVYRSPSAPRGESFEEAAPLSFLSMTESVAKGRYEKVWKEVLSTGSIAIDVSRKEETGENRLMIGFPRRTINHFQANVSRVMARNAIEITRKYTVTIGGPRPVIVASLYAREGFPVSELIAYYWGRGGRVLKDQPNFAAAFLPGGEPPKKGDIFKNPDLARTYEILARDGRDAFYRGELTQTIASFCSRVGCYLTAKDFADHTSTWVELVSTNYRGYDVWELPPNGQGIAALQMLNLLEPYDLTSMGHNSGEYLHRLIEAKKIAFEDRARFYADPDFVKVPTATLISKT
jgi:hypothetical protein